MAGQLVKAAIMGGITGGFGGALSGAENYLSNYGNNLISGGGGNADPSQPQQSSPNAAMIDPRSPNSPFFKRRTPRTPSIDPTTGAYGTGDSTYDVNPPQGGFGSGGF